MKLGKLFETYIFKKRLVFLIPPLNINQMDRIFKITNVEIKQFDFTGQSQEELRSSLSKIIPTKRVDKYSHRYRLPEDWVLWLAYMDGVPAGCLWALNIKQNGFKFDSYIHADDQILIGSVYVEKKYRGHNLYNRLQAEALQHINTWWPQKTVISIVENSNLSSVKSNQKYGVSLYGKNYLIKLFGKNVFSIFIDQKGQKKIWFLPKYKQTHH